MVVFNSLGLPFIPSIRICVQQNALLCPQGTAPTCSRGVLQGSLTLWVQDLLAAEAASQRVGGPSAAGARALAPRAPGVPQAVAVLLRARGPGALWGTRARSVWVLSEPGSVCPNRGWPRVSGHEGLVEDEAEHRVSDSFQFNHVHMFGRRNIWVQGPQAVTEKGQGLHEWEWMGKGGQN